MHSAQISLVHVDPNPNAAEIGDREEITFRRHQFAQRGVEFDDRAVERRAERVDRSRAIFVARIRDSFPTQTVEAQGFFRGAQGNRRFLELRLDLQHGLLRGNSIGEKALGALEAFSGKLLVRFGLKIDRFCLSELDRVDLGQFSARADDLPQARVNPFHAARDARADVCEAVLIEIHLPGGLDLRRENAPLRHRGANHDARGGFGRKLHDSGLVVLFMFFVFMRSRLRGRYGLRCGFRLGTTEEKGQEQGCECRGRKNDPAKYGESHEGSFLP